MASNYPPGVTGNEPAITGIYPCPTCGGSGTEDGQSNCWYCGGTGDNPDMEPKCPSCDSTDTYFLIGIADNYYEEDDNPGLLRQEMWWAAENQKLDIDCYSDGILCRGCNEVTLA